MTSIALNKNQQFGLFGDSDASGIDAAHVTFVGGAKEPGHLWYPYLEGFSPEFVRHVFARHMPAAHRILDPFAGTGTTPLTVSSWGLTAGYSEINPVLRFVIDAKIAVASLPPAKRRTLRGHLQELAAKLAARVFASAPDAGIANAYGLAFGESRFFKSETFDEVLRLRGLADEVLRSNRLLGTLLVIAAMSRLVSCSLLKRAGDVRFKTPQELQKGVPPLISSVAAQLRQMAVDVDQFDCCPTRPMLVGMNAKELADQPSFGADGVITSPPYLNGTNYIRNTKLELWFLRALKSKSDLRDFRDQVVTSGINDVDARTPTTHSVSSIASVVDEISANAYDARIPRMVAGYFADMGRVLSGLYHQTVSGAILCIDIGDSRYAGVHVQTPRLLAEIAEAVGFRVRDVMPLRSRLSKDKTELSQELIVLERKPSSSLNRPSNGNRDRRTAAKWLAFKEQLPHRQHPYAARNWGHPLHSVCSYAGKMKPALAHALVNVFSSPGDVVFDPFSGSGTIPFEAALNARQALGLDIALLPVVITNAKLVRSNPIRVASFLNQLSDWIAHYSPTAEDLRSTTEVRFNKQISDFFHERTLKEIIAARAFFRTIKTTDPEYSLVLASMLHILHGNRPYALSRRSHPITPYAPTGLTVYKSVIQKLTDKATRSLQCEYPKDFNQGCCLQSDALSEWPGIVRDIDALITSPPFYDSTRFYIANWMRYWFAGWERSDFDTNAPHFVETKQRKSFAVYSELLEQARDRLRDGAFVVFHLGLSKKCDMAKQILAAVPNGFDVVDVFNETVEHCESHGIRDKGTVTEHQYLILRKG